MRSQNSSAVTVPASVSTSPSVALSARQVESLAPPRPVSEVVRGMPSTLKLYLAAPTPSAARFSMMRQMPSISRSRSPGRPSTMPGAWCWRSMPEEGSGSCTMSRIRSAALMRSIWRAMTSRLHS